MKITPINSYKPNFGYDKKLNLELKEELKNHPDRRWASTISTLNTHCNRLENNLRSAEKDKGKKDPHFEDYIDVFSSSKQMLVSLVEATFEHLHFADREFTHYRDEFIKKTETDSDDWRIEVCEYLAPLTSEEIQNKINPIQNKEITKSVTKQREETPQTQVSKLSTKSHLEEFKPNKKTPKGFDDVIGMKKLKRDLQEGIIQYITDPQQAELDFEEYGKEIPRAVLLYGPPGCGKTYIAQALSQETNYPLYMLTIGKSGSHYMNMTSKNIKEAFDEAIKIAEETQRPCLLFMDEVDSIGFNRKEDMEPDDLKTVATLLQCMDKAESSNVIVLSATNKIDILDPAVKRRHTTKTFVDVPDEEARIGLVRKTLTPMKKSKSLLASDEDLKQIAKLLDGYSSESICKITKEAALCAMRRDRAEIAIEDFKLATKETTEEKPDRKAYMSEYSKKSNKIGF